VPAAFCGIYGMRPTHGRVARGGLDADGAVVRHSGLVRVRAGVLRAVAPSCSTTAASTLR